MVFPRRMWSSEGSVYSKFMHQVFEETILEFVMVIQMYREGESDFFNKWTYIVSCLVWSFIFAHKEFLKTLFVCIKTTSHVLYNILNIIFEVITIEGYISKVQLFVPKLIIISMVPLGEHSISLNKLMSSGIHDMGDSLKSYILFGTEFFWIYYGTMSSI